MTLRIGLTAAMMLAFFAGCASKNTAPSMPASSTTPITDFERSKDPPISAHTRFAAGELAQSQGDYGLAIKQFKDALRIDPQCVEAMYGMGIVYSVTKDYEDAIPVWKQYVGLTHSATAYSNLGFCQELAGKAGDAEASYKQGIALDPTNEACHVNYGLMLARHERANEALMELQAVLPPAQAHYDLASAYEMIGHKPQARAEYARALELDPKLNDAKMRMAALSVER